MAPNTFTQYSTLRPLGVAKSPDWIPPEHRDRAAAYTKYDEIYWNDPRQFALRVLDGEEPLYIPNARVIVDTIAHYLMKDLVIHTKDDDPTSALAVALAEFLTREKFYSRFHTAKHAGVAQGDFVFHLTADPSKPESTRISLNAVDPGIVFPVKDPDNEDRIIGYDLVNEVYVPNADPNQPDDVKMKVLKYRLDRTTATQRVSREESIWELVPAWHEKEPVEFQKTLPFGYLDPRITQLPVFWFKNIDWAGQEFGSSDLRGVESLLVGVSQGSTDTQSALSLEGLGVYVTDGGRPIDDDGNEVDWQVAPGKVMEVTTGSKFTRVQGVGSITPMRDQISALEEKLRETSALTPIALGIANVNANTSGIALQIQFSPTIAKVQERDIAGVEVLKQLFFNWQIWYGVFESGNIDGDLVIELGDKLPVNRQEIINELNNAYDRHLISANYYRSRLVLLGYIFPETMIADIDKDIELLQKLAGAGKDLAATEGIDAQPDVNNSNNAARVNETNGSEAAPPKL